MSPNMQRKVEKCMFNTFYRVKNVPKMVPNYVRPDFCSNKDKSPLFIELCIDF